MCCDVILLILGIIVLIKGQVMLTRTKEVRGTPARVIGVLLILPLPLGFLAGLLLGAFYVAQGKPVTKSEIQGVGTILGVAIIVLCVLTAIVVASAYAQPIRKRRVEDEIELANPPDRYSEHFRSAEGRRYSSRSEAEDTSDDPPRSFPPPDDRIQG